MRLGEMPVGQMQIDRGRVEVLVPHQYLNGAQVDAGLEKMGREAVAQRVNATTAFEAGAAFGRVENILGRAAQHGAGAPAVGKEPFAGAKLLPVAAQLVQQQR